MSPKHAVERWWLSGQRQRRPNIYHLFYKTFQLINSLCEISILIFLSDMVIDISKGNNLLVEKNLTSKTLLVDQKVNFEPCIWIDLKLTYSDRNLFPLSLGFEGRLTL